MPDMGSSPRDENYWVMKCYLGPDPRAMLQACFMICRVRLAGIAEPNGDNDLTSRQTTIGAKLAQFGRRESILSLTTKPSSS